MLLAALRVGDPLGMADLPLASNALGCLSLALGGWTFWRLGRIWNAPWAAVAGLLLFPTFPHLLSTLGAETIFSIVLILLAFLAYAHARYSVVALLLALATITRADAVLAGGVLVADFLLRRRGPIPWRSLLVYLALIAPWLVFATLYFGGPFPVTLFVKQRQALLPGSQSFVEGFLQVYGPGYWRKPLYWPHFALAGIGLGYALSRDRRWLVVPAWSSGLLCSLFTARRDALFLVLRAPDSWLNRADCRRRGGVRSGFAALSPPPGHNSLRVNAGSPPILRAGTLP